MSPSPHSCNIQFYLVQFFCAQPCLIVKEIDQWIPSLSEVLTMQVTTEPSALHSDVLMYTHAPSVAPPYNAPSLRC
jgi:hypothetical protein